MLKIHGGNRPVDRAHSALRSGRFNGGNARSCTLLIISKRRINVKQFRPVLQKFVQFGKMIIDNLCNIFAALS